MNQILLTIGLITFIVFAIFNIIYLIDLRKTSVALRRFITKTDENINPALEELRRTLADIRKITGEVSAVAEKLRVAVGAVVTVEKGIQSLYAYYKSGVGQAASANISGIKAGVKAGVINLLKNLRHKEGSS
jgi:uncharacterized protein YoxC